MSHSLTAALIGCIIGAVSPVVCGQEVARTIDFKRDIAPIIQTQCIQCHNSDQISGGLSLDSRELAEQGGDSGLSILTADDASNELLARVRSEDAAYRMPKDSSSLSQAQINLLARWMSEGAQWDEAADEEESQSPIDRIAEFADWVDESTSMIPGRPIFIGAILAILFVMLIVEKLKERTVAALPTIDQRSPLIARIHWGYYIVPIFVWIGSLGLTVHRIQLEKSGEEIADLESRLESKSRELSRYTGRGSTTDIFGSPPRPRHPNHEPTLSHTYYRGNCERNTALFNDGNYRTAEFTVSLQDEAGESVAAGSTIEDRKLNIRFELRRAPGTAQSLFSKSIIHAVFLTERYYARGDQVGAEPILRMTAEDPEWKWSTKIPVGQLKSEGQSRGTIYFYSGQIKDTVRAEAHYAVSYSLVTEEGRLKLESEIWMGALFLAPRVLPPPPAHRDKVPFDEWFSHEPIPAITGKNSTDPKLLGIPEHVKDSRSQQ